MISKDKIRHPLFGWVEVGEGFLISCLDNYKTVDSLIRYVELYGYKVSSSMTLEEIKYSVMEQFRLESNYG